MRTKIIKAAIGFSAAAVVAGIGLAAPAQAAPQKGQHCVTVIGKAAKGKMSPVVSKTCADGKDAPSLKAAAASSTLLMVAYENTVGNGGAQMEIRGNAGPCDIDGYRYRFTGYMANRTSAFQTYSYCNLVTGYDLINYSGDRMTWRNGLPTMYVDYVGAMNDRIESLWIRRE
ncbi:hypothetical protein BTM25_34470 [Actinomadura rubteroloni]|uniref:Uncharacterized protein n=1 Tax=Actinomadura rubteroloni TaxID=1926885 RepID=A0A2P4UIB6_9ACTN|nr:hypothetical protein [Actinomadura rubteroloni]POM24809.1 hypothetical protein BTM25_34470 [Actinomadura rubteroloni]